MGRGSNYSFLPQSLRAIYYLKYASSSNAGFSNFEPASHSSLEKVDFRRGVSLIVLIPANMLNQWVLFKLGVQLFENYIWHIHYLVL